MHDIEKLNCDEKILPMSPPPLLTFALGIRSRSRTISIWQILSSLETSLLSLTTQNQ